MKYSKECGTLARDTYGGPDPLIRVLPSRRSPQYGGLILYFHSLTQLNFKYNEFIYKEEETLN